jgi:hypothetical protein
MASKYHTREKEEKEDFLLGSSRHPDYYYRNSIQRMQDWWAANPIKRKVYRPRSNFFVVLSNKNFEK